MSQEVASFVNASIKNSLTMAIRELCLRRPHHQAYFIADYLERHAISLEKASLRKEVEDRERAEAPVPVVEENFDELVLRQLAPCIDILNKALTRKSDGDLDLESFLGQVAKFMYAMVAGATTSYVGKKVYGYNKSVEYMHVCGNMSRLPALVEGKGVTWGVWSDSGNAPSCMYVEDVLFDRQVEFLVSYPRSGSLLVIRAGGDYVVGVDTVGSGVVGIEKTVRDFLEFFVARIE